MCWNTSIQKLGKPKTAMEDIRVFKVCVESEEGVAKSYFRSFLYKPGETYEEPLFQKYDIRSRIDGIHSYSTECTFAEIPQEPYDRRGDFKYAVFRPGIAPMAGASAGNVNEWYGLDYLSWYERRWETTRLAECVIPKGSLYCVNEFGEYVSNRIRVERILTYGEWKERHPA